jgi:hypothetical protein
MLHTVNDESVGHLDPGDVFSMLKAARGKVVLETSELLSPTREAFLALLGSTSLETPATPATPTSPLEPTHPVNMSGGESKLAHFFGEAMDAESSALFAIARTGHLSVKHTCKDGGKKVKGVGCSLSL